MEMYFYPFPICTKVYLANHSIDYIVYDVWLLVELITVYFLFVETAGTSLESTAVKLDGQEVRDQMAEGVAHATGKKSVVAVTDKERVDGEQGSV